MGSPHEEWLLLVEGKEAESGILHEGPQTTCLCHCWQVGGGWRVLTSHADFHTHPVSLSQNLR